MNDEHTRLIFKLKNNYSHWQSKARKLKHCADLLFNAFLAARALPDEEQAATLDSEIDDVATLLYGMAMEDILKAALLKLGKAKMKPDDTVDWGSPEAKQHNLPALHNLLQPDFQPLNPGQNKLMERMSAFVCWAGKYPTPLEIENKAKNKEFKGFRLSDQPRAGKKTQPVPFDVDDKYMFDQIYKAVSGSLMRTTVLTIVKIQN